MSSFNLANWEEHPTDSRYFIFRFNKVGLAEDFEQRLNTEKVQYQSHQEDGHFMFGVSRNDFERVRKLNYLVMAAHREPMIANGILRWALVLFMIAAVTIAFIGHCNKTAQDNVGIHTPPLEKRGKAL